MLTTTQKAERRNRKSELAAMRARLDRITEGLVEEVHMLNDAIRRGAVVRFPDGESLISGKQVDSASWTQGGGLWARCKNYGGAVCLSNDERWGALLAQAGIARDPRTA